MVNHTIYILQLQLAKNEHVGCSVLVQNLLPDVKHIGLNSGGGGGGGGGGGLELWGPHWIKPSTKHQSHCIVYMDTNHVSDPVDGIPLHTHLFSLEEGAPILAPLLHDADVISRTLLLHCALQHLPALDQLALEQVDIVIQCQVGQVPGAEPQDSLVQ